MVGLRMEPTGCHNVPGARQAGLDLGESVARECHGLLQHAGVDISGAGCLTKPVGVNVGVIEHGGVDLGLWSGSALCVHA